MRSDGWDKVDELADSLDDVMRLVDELVADPPAGAEPKMIGAIRESVAKAREAIDDLDDQESRPQSLLE